jgi:hypothetical protein
MKQFFQNVAHFLRTHRFSVRRRYDVAQEFYRDRDDPQPAFAYALKGEYHIDLRHILAAVGTLCTLALLLRRRR